jgi:hypothetical protein
MVRVPGNPQVPDRRQTGLFPVLGTLASSIKYLVPGSPCPCLLVAVLTTKPAKITLDYWNRVNGWWCLDVHRRFCFRLRDRSGTTMSFLVGCQHHPNTVHRHHPNNLTSQQAGGMRHNFPLFGSQELYTLADQGIPNNRGSPLGEPLLRRLSSALDTPTALCHSLQLYVTTCRYPVACHVSPSLSKRQPADLGVKAPRLGPLV